MADENRTVFTPLTGNIFYHFDYLFPSWSLNGTKLALAISQTIGIDTYNTQAGVCNPDGISLFAIKSDAALWTRTSWSGDRSKIVYTSSVGGREGRILHISDGSSSGTIVINTWDANYQQ